MRALQKVLAIGLLSLGFIHSAHAILPIEKLDLHKGAKVYLVQTKTLPMVDIEISIDAGDRYDPKRQEWFSRYDCSPHELWGAGR